MNGRSYAPRITLNPDDEYDAMVERVDLGEECPVCHLRAAMKRSPAFGLPLFTCPRCDTKFFDWITRPATEVK